MRRTKFHTVLKKDASTADVARDVVSAYYASNGLTDATRIVRVEHLVVPNRKRPIGWLVSVSVNTKYKRDRDRLERMQNESESE
jgi:hypothetical protein